MPRNGMRLVVFGLSVSSSWGNGHATLWRGLIRALSHRGHRVVFFERDTPYYSAHRDLWELPGSDLVLYSNWAEVLPSVRRHLALADAGLITSYCPDAVSAAEELFNAPLRARAFYDLDTPVTLEQARTGPVPYIPPSGLGDFDVVLSYTGGEALDALCRRFGARQAVPLYGSVDPEQHFPVAPKPPFRGDFSYLGTYAANRQVALERLFLEPARRLPGKIFVIGGSMYPPDFPWTQNLHYVRHLPPSDHSAFYCSSPLTLNVTRAPMAAMGYCPSGRLFEAAACGCPVLSDRWEGLDTFFSPGSEILLADSPEEVVNILQLSHQELSRVGQDARERTLTEHTAARRAQELISILESAAKPAPAQAGILHSRAEA